jgi:hypothetical protein
MLEPIKSATPPKTENKRVIALAPVHLPDYLNRPQIVTASAENAYSLSEFNRWAERLDDNISRVLAQNLGVLVPADIVLLNSASRSKQASLKVAVDILEFHIDPQGQAGLAAQWRIIRGEEVLAGRQMQCREAASTTDYRVMVGALNRCVERLSGDLAEALRPLSN